MPLKQTDTETGTGTPGYVPWGIFIQYKYANEMCHLSYSTRTRIDHRLT